MTSIKNRREAIAARAQLLAANKRALMGNTTTRKQYIQDLQSINLTFYQYSLVLGMLLSDASIDFSGAEGTYRLKIQQSEEHVQWLETVRNDLIEYTGESGVVPVRRDRSNMYELDTLKCYAFNNFIRLLYDEKKKVVKPEIKPLIDQVVVANWFCGDGGKRGTVTDKGILFHTQGFTKEGCDILSEALRNNLDLEAKTTEDTHNRWPEPKYTVLISATSYDLFITEVGPYIHPCFKDRLPPPRSIKSRFGRMKPDLFDSLVSSKLTGDYVETYKRTNY